MCPRLLITKLYPRITFCYSLSTDIMFGAQANFKTCVVLTGDCKTSDIEHWDSFKNKEKPDYVASNLAELCQIDTNK